MPRRAFDSMKELADRPAMTQGPSQPPTEAQRDAAARWLVRLDGGVLPAADRAAFRAWLAADPRHAAALEAARETWRRLDGPARALAAERAGRLATLRAGGRRAGWIGRRPGWRGAARWAGRGLAAAACLLAAWVFLPGLGERAADLTADAAAGRGEIRLLDLPDGSRLELASDTAVDLSFDSTGRLVRLRRGEAYFEVRGGQPHAFVVDVGEGTVRVVGTRFNIRRSGRDVSIAVAEGRVDVRERAGAGLASLEAGRQALLREGRLVAVGEADLDATLAWRTGRVVFYREPLAAVAGRLERQRPGRIVVAGERLAGMKVSGAFPADDVDGALQAIADTLGARIVSVTPWLTVIY